MPEQIKVTVINLIHRNDRLEQFDKQAKEQGFIYDVQVGQIFKHDRKKGVCVSHKEVVRKAKENGDEIAIICEDDCLFVADGAFDYFIANIPKSFDLYLSMVYVGEISEDNRVQSVCSGFTCYIVHSRFYDTFLSIPDSSHVDREITKMYKDYEFIVCDKFCTKQSGGFSDNCLKFTESYDTFLTGRKIFGL